MQVSNCNTDEYLNIINIIITNSQIFIFITALFTTPIVANITPTDSAITVATTKNVIGMVSIVTRNHHHWQKV